jgi:hypothetical protein
MSKRITRETLEKMVARITELTGRPTEQYTGVAPNCKPNVGALTLDHNANYGGYDLTELKERGGSASLIGNSFAGNGRMSPKEMHAFLSGILYALETLETYPQKR